MGIVPQAGMVVVAALHTVLESMLLIAPLPIAQLLGIVPLAGAVSTKATLAVVESVLWTGQLSITASCGLTHPMKSPYLKRV